MFGKEESEIVRDDDDNCGREGIENESVSVDEESFGMVRVRV